MQNAQFLLNGKQIMSMDLSFKTWQENSLDIIAKIIRWIMYGDILGVPHSCYKVNPLEDEITQLDCTWEVLRGLLENVPGLIQQLGNTALSLEPQLTFWL